MEVDANVWVKSSPDGKWERAFVTKMEDILPKKKKDTEILTKFTLQGQTSDGEAKGGLFEVLSGRVEGSPEEFVYVKLRNQIDSKGEINVEDLTTLNHLHEPSILHCIHIRFENDMIYTNTGPILVAVNPFKKLSIYGVEFVQKYRVAGETSRFKEDRASRLPPHVFQVADKAYRSMVDTAERGMGGVANQSILVSGESGAGKTVTTKFIMKYLADITRVILSPPTPRGKSKVFEFKKVGDIAIEEQVLQSNPILECFGNARTLRNDNSSRFGKFIEIKFAPSQATYYRIIGATIRTYLLEKVRLVRQAKGERNFHCFYELIKGGSASDKSRLGLTTLNDFHYTNQSGEVNRQDGILDQEQFKETKSAMDDMKFTKEEQERIFDVIAAVLHLGNISFDPKTGTVDEEDGSTISPSSSSHYDYFSNLLGITKDALELVLCEKQIKTMEKVFKKRQTVSEAEYARDTLAKTIYGSLFEWIVKRVNTVVTGESSPTSNKKIRNMTFIGVLDIFGFESFETNSFEQLCINYTNEHLQHHFNAYVFDDEQKLYKREGITWSFIKFPDNNEVLDLLENRRTGLFALCDEQVLFPRATDITLVRKFYEHCVSHPRFSANAMETANHHFVVKHFAGPVTYSSASFLEKNHDVVRRDMAHLLRNATAPLMSQLVEFFRMEDSESHSETSASNKRNLRGTTAKKVFTLGGEFRKQLGELMDNINTTSPHYIRCLKPNSKNVHTLFEHHLVVDQLRCNGLLEAVRVSRAGYPNRFPFEQFGRRYGRLTVNMLGSPWNKDKIAVLCSQLVDSILSNSAFTPSIDSTGLTDRMLLAGIQQGTSMIFLRRGTFDHLERGILQQQRVAAIKIQTKVRGFVYHSIYKKMKKAAIIIQCAVRYHRLRRRWHVTRERNARLDLQRMARGFLTRLHVSKTMPQIFKLHEKLAKLREVKKILEMKKAVQQALLVKQIRNFCLRKRFAKQHRASVKIQASIRRWLCRGNLAKMRREALIKANKDRENLSKQLAEIKKAAAAEKELLTKNSKSQYQAAIDEINTLKSDLKKSQAECERWRQSAKEWEENTLIARKAYLERPKDPVCDEATLRAMITEEVISQIAAAQSETLLYKSKAETTEIQNITILTSIAMMKPSQSSDEKDSGRKINSRPSFVKSMSLTEDTRGRDEEHLERITSNYQKDVDSFDKNFEDLKRNKKEQVKKKIEVDKNKVVELIDDDYLFRF